MHCARAWPLALQRASKLKMLSHREAAASFDERRESARRLEWPATSVAGIDNGRVVWWRECWNPALLA
jgi:hypothetical protein